MTPQEWATTFAAEAQTRTDDVRQAAQAAAERASAQIGVLASRAGNGTVRVQRSGDAVVLQMTTTSRGLAAEVRRWARDDQRAKDLAEEVRRVRA